MASAWGTVNPDKLRDICLLYCVTHLEIIADYDEEMDLYHLKDDITLPTEICESLLKTYRDDGFVIDDKFLNIFGNPAKTRLRKANLRDSQTVTNYSVELVLNHGLAELDISNCYGLTSDSVTSINTLGKSLEVLHIGTSRNLFLDLKPYGSEDEEEEEEEDGVEGGEDNENNAVANLEDLAGGAPVHNETCRTCESQFVNETCKSEEGEECVYGRDYIFNCPRLRIFSLHNFNNLEHDIVGTILTPLPNLQHLDLTGCNVQLEFMDCLESLKKLVSLVLFDVTIHNIQDAFNIFVKLKRLRHLDIGQSLESPVKYSEPEESLHHLVSNLPHLRSLDISGTNLAGFEKTKAASFAPAPRGAASSESEDVGELCSIPGLEGRHFDYLGLLGCAHAACHRKYIPASRVTGDATEEQTITSVQVYVDKPEMLITALNHLFHIFRFSVCKQQKQALEVLLAAMKRHPDNKHIQISGSASLFYIVKGEEKHNINFQLKRRILKLLLEGMEKHLTESTMLRNGCLTLCHFKIPQEVLCFYQRMVKLILKMVTVASQEEFVQRIGMFLLNSLACHVDGKEKKLIGELGAMTIMLRIISQKLAALQCDEIMEIAWSTMWNVTDETAVNCRRFIDGGGMDLFLRCLEEFAESTDLLRNMMGLMGNVAEVPELRPCLMTSEYVSVFSDLVDSTSDGIEVSYNATGVLSHMAADGPTAWTISEPSYEEVLARMVSAIQRWQLNTRRNINYRSFEPILRLLPKYETPQAQHWAVWALANLTTVYPDKYCPLVEKEHGLVLLQAVLDDPRPYAQIKDLARKVLDECKLYHCGQASPSEDEMEVVPQEGAEEGQGDGDEQQQIYV